MAGFRRFKRRYLPFLLEGYEVRRLRDRLLRKVGLTRAYEPEALTLNPTLRFDGLLSLVAAAHVLEHGEIRFLQVGAFDGEEGDAIVHLIENYPARGVLVEPQPRVFERLRNRHERRGDLTLVNAAIDSEGGSRPFYLAKDADVQFASFDRGHLLRHGLTADEIEAVEVECLTIDDVLDRAGMESVDLVQVDAEGHDYEILRSINLERLAPKMIRFEHRHFDRSDLTKWVDTLAEHNYRFLTEKLDVLAIRSEVQEPVILRMDRPMATTVATKATLSRRAA
jgi:FkbM family methyltransferase